MSRSVSNLSSSSHSTVSRSQSARHSNAQTSFICEHQFRIWVNINKVIFNTKPNPSLHYKFELIHGTSQYSGGLIKASDFKSNSSVELSDYALKLDVNLSRNQNLNQFQDKNAQLSVLRLYSVSNTLPTENTKRNTVTGGGVTGVGVTGGKERTMKRSEVLIGKQHFEIGKYASIKPDSKKVKFEMNDGSVVVYGTIRSSEYVEVKSGGEALVSMEKKVELLECELKKKDEYGKRVYESYKELKEMYEKVRREYGELGKRRDEVEEENRELKRELGERNVEMLVMMKREKECEKCGEMERDKMKMEVEVERLGKENDGLVKEKSENKMEVVEAKKEREKWANKCDGMEKKWNEERKLNAEYKMELVKVKSELKRSNEELKRSENELNRVRTLEKSEKNVRGVEVERLEEKVKDLERENGMLKKELNEKCSEVLEEQKEQNEKLKNVERVDKSTGFYEAEIAALQNENRMLNEVNSKLKKNQTVYSERVVHVDKSEYESERLKWMKKVEEVEQERNLLKLENKRLENVVLMKSKESVNDEKVVESKEKVEMVVVNGYSAEKVKEKEKEYEKRVCELKMETERLQNEILCERKENEVLSKELYHLKSVNYGLNSESRQNASEKPNDIELESDAFWIRTESQRRSSVSYALVETKLQLAQAQEQIEILKNENAFLRNTTSNHSKKSKKKSILK